MFVTVRRIIDAPIVAPVKFTGAPLDVKARFQYVFWL